MSRLKPGDFAVCVVFFAAVYSGVIYLGFSSFRDGWVATIAMAIGWVFRSLEEPPQSPPVG